MSPFQAGDGVLSVRVRLTPHGGRDSIDGIETLADGTAVLLARVRAAAQNGEANDALRALLAKAAGAPRSRVALKRGASSRIKLFEIDGEPAAIEARLRAATG
ncbi:UPF0235 protein [Methylopila jiangsuensis]|uniref:UPF0235 protein GCM10008171_14400 n=1 Tax=Methylopila jiangsuensis TaxID=586230 RepID=A0A9W6JEM5_9HYPH|nr:DUF167 family protein [Methylopila jiangsuensis]MDR6284296.1 hypothetical protein [Methylopila jiangsuensis]GLK76186.1 UPF0235 protein [Methylopila jiangsuensis]